MGSCFTVFTAWTHCHGTDSVGTCSFPYVCASLLRILAPWGRVVFIPLPRKHPAKRICPVSTCWKGSIHKHIWQHIHHPAGSWHSTVVRQIYKTELFPIFRWGNWGAENTAQLRALKEHLETLTLKYKHPDKTSNDNGAYSLLWRRICSSFLHRHWLLRSGQGRENLRAPPGVGLMRYLSPGWWWGGGVECLSAE